MVTRNKPPKVPTTWVSRRTRRTSGPRVPVPRHTNGTMLHASFIRRDVVPSAVPRPRRLAGSEREPSHGGCFVTSGNRRAVTTPGSSGPGVKCESSGLVLVRDGFACGIEGFWGYNTRGISPKSDICLRSIVHCSRAASQADWTGHDNTPTEHDLARPTELCVARRVRQNSLHSQICARECSTVCVVRQGNPPPYHHLAALVPAGRSRVSDAIMAWQETQPVRGVLAV